MDEQPEGSTNGGWDRFSERLTSALVGAVSDGDARDRPEAADIGAAPSQDVADDDRQWRNHLDDRGLTDDAGGVASADPFRDLDGWAPDAAAPSAPATHDDAWLDAAAAPATHDDAWLDAADAPDTEDDAWSDDADHEPEDHWDEEGLAASLSSRMLGFTPGRGGSPPPAHRRRRTERWHDRAPAWWAEHRMALWSVAAAVLVVAVGVALATRGGGHTASTSGRVAVSASTTTTTPTTPTTLTTGTTLATDAPTSLPPATDTGVPTGNAGLGNQVASYAAAGGTFGSTGRAVQSAGYNPGVVQSPGGVVQSPGGSPAPVGSPATTAATAPPRTTMSSMPGPPPTYTIPSFTIPTFTVPQHTTTTVRRH